MNIFKKKKNAKQISEGLSDALAKHVECTSEDTAATLVKRLDECDVMLNGSETATLKVEDANQLSTLLQDSSAMYQLVCNLIVVPFESRKRVVAIFNTLVGRDLSGFASVYCERIKDDLLQKLVFAYHTQEVALHCGSMLRQLLKHAEICKAFLYSKDMVLLDRFFNEYLQMDNLFDISSDAFATFRDAVTLHKQIAASFMEERYSDFFTRLNTLLVADSYVTQRQSLKLLSEILLQRANYRVMKLYIGDKNNLKLVMNLLRVKSKAIRVETFHVFKVFVANPNKTDEVANILYRNRDKLIQFLASFEVTTEAEQINEEKALLIKSLQSLAAPPEDESNAAEGSTQTTGNVPVAEASAPAAAAAAASAPAAAAAGNVPAEESSSDAQASAAPTEASAPASDSKPAPAEPTTAASNTSSTNPESSTTANDPSDSSVPKEVNEKNQEGESVAEQKVETTTPAPTS